MPCAAPQPNGSPRLRDALLERLLDPEALVVFDGAMGTMIYARGVFINQCYDELSIRAPELIRAIHDEYVHAGAEVIETNTFGANRIKLEQHGLSAEVRQINTAAAKLARAAAGDTVLVAGAVGPLGVRLEPYGPTSRDDARAIFAEQMRALKDGGADLFILETFSDLDELTQAIAAARDVDAATPVIAQAAINADGVTAYGATPEDIVRTLEAIEKMAPLTARKLSAQPNAGMPRDVGGRTMYMASPEYMSTYARHLVVAGAKLIGGCCGTTPAHVREIAEGVRPLAPRSGRTSRATVTHVPPENKAAGVAPVPFAERSRWAKKIAGGEFVTSVELVPPRGVDASKLLRDAASLREAGVDAINVPDGPRAQSRMGAVLTSL